MEIVLDKAREYILALKDAGNFTFEDIANVSGIPLQTVRNICSGKTPDARFGTIAKIVTSLGGDLNELVGYEKKKETEVNSIVSLKESYELIIADVQKQCEVRIADIKALSDLRVADVRADADKRVEDLVRFYEARIKEMKGSNN